MSQLQLMMNELPKPYQNFIPDRGTWKRIRSIPFENKFEDVSEWVEQGEHLAMEWKKNKLGYTYFFHITEALECNAIFYPSHQIPDAIYTEDQVDPKAIIENIYNRRIESYSPGGEMYKKNEKRIEELCK